MRIETLMEPNPLIYQFDGVRVDLNSFKVFKAGSVVHLEPKAFEVLVFTHRAHL